MDLSLEALFSILGGIAAVSTFAFFLRHERQKQQNYYSVTWKSSKSLKPNDLMGERPFNSVYEFRDFDDRIVSLLKDFRKPPKNNPPPSILIKGQPLAGKTRAVYEALKKSDEQFDILIPKCRDIDPDSFVIPRRARWWRTGIIILDDLNRFVEKRDFEVLLNEIVRQNYSIIATTRTGADYQRLENKCLERVISLDSIFGENIIEIPPLDETTAQKVADKNHLIWISICNRFNGTIGSLFMKLEVMQTRFNQSPDPQKAILFSIKKLYLCGIFDDRATFPLDWIRMITPSGIDWDLSLEKLQNNEFIKIKNNSLVIETAYIEEIIHFPVTQNSDPLYLCIHLADLFKNDGRVLLKIAHHLLYLEFSDQKGSTTKNTSRLASAIALYQKVLDGQAGTKNASLIRQTRDNLLSEFRSLMPAEKNSDFYRQTITDILEELKKIPPDTCPEKYSSLQHELGSAYMNLASHENPCRNYSRAIEAFDAALTILSGNTSSVEYAKTQNNRAISFRYLADITKNKEHVKQAITSFHEVLKVRTKELFPEKNALTLYNLGIAYVTLSRFEDNIRNCECAITLFSDAAKILTLETSPEDYALNLSALGTAYQTLASERDTKGNFKKAISLYDEALEILTREKFPSDYARIQYSRGVAYQKLADLEETHNNCLMSFQAFTEVWETPEIHRQQFDPERIRYAIASVSRSLRNAEENQSHQQQTLDLYDQME